MDKSKLYDYERLVTFRKDIHKHPELAFTEYRTGEKIYEYLESIGIKQNQIRKVAKTGFIVDIKGKAPESGIPFCIALRTDLDALPIKEETPDIDYKSQNENGHMCGHDIHMASLLGGASKILENIDKIPSDKTVRLLFQPAEERYGGAFPMIQEGCLDGVDEVYGFHNWPSDTPGKLIVKEGALMAASTRIILTIYGKGGHASEVDKLNDPLQAGVDIQVGIRAINKKYKDLGKNFVLSLPVMKGANAPNVISETCEVSGVLRAFDDDDTVKIMKDIEDLIRQTCAKRKCNLDLFLRTNYPTTVNHKTETAHVLRVAKKVFGEKNIVIPEKPFHASEDFSFYLKQRPGCFFFLSSGKDLNQVLHTNQYNPDDDVIKYASEMYLQLAFDRFGIDN